jgi:NTE family protein
MQQEKLVLVLQGGGALGAYQAGAYEALCAGGNAPQWLAGISIGAINAAIIAGNTPENRVPKLHAFWNKLSSGLQGASVIPGNHARSMFNEVSSWTATMFGIPGFFIPRAISPAMCWLNPDSSLSFYDTAPLRQTLEELVDFKLLNNGEIRLSVGAVNIRTGNFRYFDTKTEKLGPEHIMASGALPPGFPPVFIEGEAYWDGGLVSNTPLHYVVDVAANGDNLCIFQVDLFSAKGTLPRSIMEVAEREKEIRYSSRTRMVTDATKSQRKIRSAALRLLSKLPETLRDDPDVKILKENSSEAGITVMHLINRTSEYDTQSKDYEFSRLSIDEHWANGLCDTQQSLKSKAWKERAIPAIGMVTFDHGKKSKDETR